MNRNDKKNSPAAVLIILITIVSIISDSVALILGLLVLVGVFLWVKWSAEKQKETGDKSAVVSFKEYVSKLKEFFKSYTDEFEYDDNSDIGSEETEEKSFDPADIIKKAKSFAEDLLHEDDPHEDVPIRQTEKSSFDSSDMEYDDPGSILKNITMRRKEEELSDCDSDHEHVDPSYDMTSDEKRRQQLKSMLDNGIIDKKEYNIMLKKYGLK